MKKTLRIIVLGMLLLTYNVQAQGSLETGVEYPNENQPKTYKDHKKSSFANKLSKIKDAVATKVAKIDKKKSGKKILKVGGKILKARKAVKRKVVGVLKNKLLKSK